jgi:hypothetical protein
MPGLKDCCAAEARKSLKRPREVATCDACGSLLLAYGTPRDFESAIDELTRHEVPFESSPSTAEGGLSIIAKRRRPRATPS